jgi:hypothetical protein
MTLSQPSRAIAVTPSLLLLCAGCATQHVPAALFRPVQLWYPAAPSIS